MSFDSIQLPRYRCHKKVWALKIKAVHGNTLEFENSHYGLRDVTDTYMQKHAPQAGGYWVQYDDGYESWSPAKTFEEGYTLEVPDGQESSE